MRRISYLLCFGLPPSALNEQFRHLMGLLPSQSFGIAQTLNLPGGRPLKTGAGVGQFHSTVYVTNPRSAQFATEAMLDKALIAINGEVDNEVRTVTGFVQSIEEVANAMPQCWRIIVREDDRHSDTVVFFLQSS